LINKVVSPAKKKKVVAAGVQLKLATEDSLEPNR
jgi:hypothetical protein